MSLINTVLREIVGLFIDDEFLALATLVVVAITAVALKGMSVDAAVAAVILPAGCIAVLVAGVWRTARSRR